LGYPFGIDTRRAIHYPEIGIPDTYESRNLAYGLRATCLTEEYMRLGEGQISMSSNTSNEMILIALMTSKSRKEAADKLGISARTIARREESADFRALYSGVQWTMVECAAALGSRALVKGMERAIELLDSPSERTQIQAIRLIAQYTPMLIKLGDLDRRASRLEENLGYELESKESG
jgi:hypothetical protein